MEAQKDRKKLTVLVVEDNPQVAELIKLYLKKDGHEVIIATDGEEGLQLALEHNLSVILLDLMLPGMNGLEVCRRVRSTKNIPIVMVTARIEENDRLIGFEQGADDYVTKPFSPRELVARVYAIMRRINTEFAKRSSTGTIKSGVARANHGDYSASWGSADLKLTRTEFRFYTFFIGNNSKTVERQHIINAVFGYDYDGMQRTVDTHISHLRQKLEKAGAPSDVIEPVYGVGYRINFNKR